MRKIKFDGEAVQLIEDGVVIAEVITDEPQNHPALQEHWLQGWLSWNQAKIAVCNSDDYENRNPNPMKKP